jgi:hypothetical protein
VWNKGYLFFSGYRTETTLSFSLCPCRIISIGSVNHGTHAHDSHRSSNSNTTEIADRRCSHFILGLRKQGPVGILWRNKRFIPLQAFFEDTKPTVELGTNCTETSNDCTYGVCLTPSARQTAIRTTNHISSQKNEAKKLPRHGKMPSWLLESV